MCRAPMSAAFAKDGVDPAAGEEEGVVSVDVNLDRLEAAVLRRAARNPIVGTKLAWLLEDIAARLALNYFMSILVNEF